MSSVGPVAVVTDSNAQMPESLVDRLGVGIVPIRIVIDGVEYAESDLDADDFYDRLAAGAEASTSQPSPGELLSAYRGAADSGATSVVSIHVAAALSGTVNSANLAADLADIEVRVVDTGQTSFSIGLCAWAASARAAEGGSLDDVCAVATNASTSISNVFVVSALELVEQTGRGVRLTGDMDGGTGAADEIPVVALRGTDLEVIGHAADVEAASDAMASVVLEENRPIRVGIGVGGREAFGFYDALESRIDQLPNVVEVIRYRCGPSVGAFSGPGIAGMAWAPVD